MIEKRINAEKIKRLDRRSNSHEIIIHCIREIIDGFSFLLRASFVFFASCNISETVVEKQP